MKSINLTKIIPTFNNMADFLTWLNDEESGSCPVSPAKTRIELRKGITIIEIEHEDKCKKYSHTHIEFDKLFSIIDNAKVIVNFKDIIHLSHRKANTLLYGLYLRNRRGGLYVYIYP